MTNIENTQKPPITDLWLAVDEEQTLRFGMRQALAVGGASAAGTAPATGARTCAGVLRCLDHDA